MTIQKRKEFDHTYYDSFGEVNGEGSLDLVAIPGSDQFVVVDEWSFSIVTIATGGGGEIQIKDTAGNILRRVDADAIGAAKMTGFKIGPGLGVQAITANGGTTQARGSVSMKAHLTFR